MALAPQSGGRHNVMLGSRPKRGSPLGIDKPSGLEVPTKKQKTRHHDLGDASANEAVLEDSEIDGNDAGENLEERSHLPPSGLESTLPSLRSDQEAIDEYESSQAARTEDPGENGSLDRLNNRKWVQGKSSIYVDAFNVALNTVLEEEENLFNAAERAVFDFWKSLSYEAQYLYVRLFLRKTAAWHRIGSLAYHNDISDMSTAIEELQTQRDLPQCSEETGTYPVDPADLHQNDLGTAFRFAESSEIITTLEEASTLLKLDELKAIAKDAKIQGKNKRELIRGLRRTSKQQVGIKASFRRSDTDASNKSETPSGHQSPEKDDNEDEDGVEQPESDPDMNRDAHFLKKILDETGPCVRLSHTPLMLFERVHLVFYRSSEWTEKSLTIMILARIARRNFPEYIVSRSASIFESRSLLLEFEASLRMQNRVDNILEFSGKPSDEGYQAILDIYHLILPRWRVLISHERNKEDRRVYESGEGTYLRRLSPAWVYTRIIHKATAVMAKFKQYKQEHSILAELLQQRFFHHARRGAWYQRKALIEEHYMPAIHAHSDTVDDIQKRRWKRTALRTCEEGLEDPLVHLIYHHDLQKRITKLERGCRIPKREQHDFSHNRLAAPVEVYVQGTRVDQPIEDTTSARNDRRNSNDAKPAPRGQKTVWLDPLEGNGECSVEAMCLSHYRSEGWKGFHCEGRIVRTLFAYLFFDILFLYVPNVFQTQFQTCPLDLHTDAFYPTRMSEINHRLVQIENGIAPQLIQRVWDEHSERKTCVVGLDWQYELADLLEIAEFFDGQALAAICKVMSQEYGTRGGGMPDLILWHPEQKQVKFAEVKSENDRLSDTQRLWIDVLTGAGVRVELCHAVAKKDTTDITLQ